MGKRVAIPLIAGAAGLCSSLAWGQSALPDGPGKTIVQTTCARCHGLGQVTRSGYDRAGWQNVVTMMRNTGATLPTDQVAVVVDYLAAHFPPKDAPAAVVIPGEVKVAIKEWKVPTPGSRPHDPLAAPDGSIWYTGQMANVLGRLDPATGTFKEYRIPLAESGPHGLVADTAGNVWFTANFKGYVGKLDPRTGGFTEYHLADPAARDPHTPIFAPDGTLWFTLQGANMIGRLVPRTGEMRLVTLPRPHAQPYGIVVDSHGTPYFAEFGANKLGSIDPRTLAIREYTLPNPEARPRRIAITSDDVLWYSDYARGYLGRYDPRTGEAREWPSPGGPNARPYGITAARGAIWYSESGVRPNTLVRFDPKSARFQTWTIPSGGGVVRNMMPTREGNLVLACSGEDTIALVVIE
ncbi:MAG TPA: cytochrome C [Candidatus Limnocylindria bacterium]|jgi:virginiamycin B lyase|nr:cytochrome C [Candidatus Limnocylindria bacterium]